MLIHLTYITIAVFSAFISLEVVGTYIWHKLFHRQGVQTYMRRKYVCGHCYYENTEEVWKENALRKIGEVIDN